MPLGSFAARRKEMVITSVDFIVENINFVRNCNRVGAADGQKTGW